MKILKLIITAIFTAAIPGFISGQDMKELPARIAAGSIESREDSLAYALAVLSYNSWARENIYPDPVIFAKAIIDSKNGNPLISEENARNIIMSFVSEIKAKQTEKILPTGKEERES